MLLLFAQPQLLSGTFVEFGAWDGLKHSTTAAFERNFNWSGPLLEPSSCAAEVKENQPKAIMSPFILTFMGRVPP